MSDEITDEQIAELKRLDEQATDAPWEEAAASGVVLAGPDIDGNRFPVPYVDDDTKLIAAMRNALPGLLARLERAERERDDAQAREAQLAEMREALENTASGTQSAHRRIACMLRIVSDYIPKKETDA